MQKQKSPPLLGAHMSIEGGVWRALERGQSIGCTAIQIFTKNNRQWKAKPLHANEIELFKTTARNTDIRSVIAHASYLINIGSADHATSEKSTMALIDELHRCSQLEIPYLVLHPGSHRGTGIEQCLTTIIKNIMYALDKSPDSVSILLETMAGQGSSVCNRFEEIATIIDQVKATKRIGVCVDTCHIFAAGYDITTPAHYQKTWKLLDESIGIKYVKAIHLNDSKKELDSRVDRHEEIGEGKIGLEGFRPIMNDPHLKNVPKILETPKNDLANYQHNMEILKQLIRQ